MSDISRRKLITGGIAAAAAVAGLDVAARLASRFGFVPPDARSLFSAGTTLSYAAQRVFARRTPAREYARDQISKRPFANEVAPLPKKFGALQAGGFADWRLVVEGMVAHPRAFSLADLKAGPKSSQITMVACEEGWDYIAEWSGVPLAHVLDAVGTRSGARYVVYQSIQPDWYESIDMDDATHPQTILAYGMNGGELPVPFGGPLRLRVPRQLGYKSVKYVTKMTVTDDLKPFGLGLGGGDPDGGYAWYAGI
jgi:DMSO/TMAO reductase YedYZ molybdopterin-dependent catalytic subunit